MSNAERHRRTGEACGDMLAKGWQVNGCSYVKPGCEREFRVVLRNPALGLKLFGFGEDFAEAFDAAQGQAPR